MVVGVALVESAGSIVIQFVALGIGTGVGAAFGLRGAIKPDVAPGLSGGSRAPRAFALLFAAGTLCGVVGFLCGATSGLLLLFPLGGILGMPSAVALSISNAVTGFVAGTITGFFAEALRGRVPWLAGVAPGVAARGALLGGGAGVVCGLLAALVASYPAGVALLAAVGVGAVAALASLLLPAARRAPAATGRASGERRR
jgi:hypothetical protein